MYLSLFFLYMHEKYIFLIVIILLLLFFIQLLWIFSKKLLEIICSFFKYSIFFIVLTSVNIVLNIPNGNAREMMGVSAVFIFIFLYVYKKGWIAKVTVIVPIYYLLTSFFYQPLYAISKELITIKILWLLMRYCTLSIILGSKR